nr:beta-galactosidase trimerization domain-containing protein [Bacillus subtilis]
MTKVGETLERLSEVVGTKRPAQTAILYDWENHWALEDAQGFAKATKRYPQTLQQSITAHSGNTISLSTSSRKNKTFHHINC